MKIRNGFVSNSSSSSFCIIGINDYSFISKLAEAEKLHFKERGKKEIERIRGCQHIIKNLEDKYCSQCGEPTWIEQEIEVKYDYLPYGSRCGKLLMFYGDGVYPYYAGLEAENLLEDKSIKDAKKYFHDLIMKKYKIDIPIYLIRLFYGETSSE